MSGSVSRKHSTKCVISKDLHHYSRKKMQRKVPVQSPGIQDTSKQIPLTFQLPLVIKVGTVPTIDPKLMQYVPTLTG